MRERLQICEPTQEWEAARAAWNRFLAQPGSTAEHRAAHARWLTDHGFD